MDTTTKHTFKKVPSSKANGTSYKGEVETYYHKLLEVFGKPTVTSTNVWDKVTCEWVIQFEDGLIATVYDWKVGETPMDLYDWHIGGTSSEVVKRIIDLVGQVL